MQSITGIEPDQQTGTEHRVERLKLDFREDRKLLGRTPTVFLAFYRLLTWQLLADNILER
jgi:hypothetical protein